MKSTVAVIGAGSTGLVALQHLAAKPDIYNPTSFEKSTTIGGLWNYSLGTGKDKFGYPMYANIYKNLYTNVPSDMMKFSGVDYRDDANGVRHHTEVQQYLEDYANHFDLKRYVRFNTVVTNIKPIESENGKVSWEIQVNDIGSGDNKREVGVFDYVIVANGVFSAPYIPEIPGLDQFRGRIIHSNSYRTPKEFTGMRVGVVGGCLSGQDVSRDVAKTATEVIFSHGEHPLAWDIPKNLKESTRIDRLTVNSMITKDGSQFEIDALILCTGFRKNLSFLSPECRVAVENDRITPLYKYVLHTEFPSLAFIGYTQYDPAFHQHELQVKFALAAWEGKFRLPSTNEMNADTQRDFELHQAMGLVNNKAQNIGFLLKSHHHDIARLGGFEPYPDRYYDVWRIMLELILTGLHYQHYDFKRDESGQIDIEEFKRFSEEQRQKATCGYKEANRRLQELRKVYTLIDFI